MLIFLILSYLIFLETLRTQAPDCGIKNKMGRNYSTSEVIYTMKILLLSSVKLKHQFHILEEMRDLHEAFQLCKRKINESGSKE